MKLLVSKLTKLQFEENKKVEIFFLIYSKKIANKILMNNAEVYQFVNCYIYRIQNSFGERRILSMLIPCQGITFPNELRNVYLLSSEQKLLVYEVVHQKLGNPPTELLLPNVEDLRSEVSSVSQSVWTYIIWWNSFSEESEIISNINTIKETFNRGYLNLVMVNMSETAFLWLCEFNDAVTDLHFYNTYVSDTAVSA